MQYVSLSCFGPIDVQSIFVYIGSRVRGRGRRPRNRRPERDRKEKLRSFLHRRPEMLYCLLSTQSTFDRHNSIRPNIIWAVASSYPRCKEIRLSAPASHLSLANKPRFLLKSVVRFVDVFPFWFVCPRAMRRQNFSSPLFPSGFIVATTLFLLRQLNDDDDCYTEERSTNKSSPRTSFECQFRSRAASEAGWGFAQLASQGRETFEKDPQSRKTYLALIELESPQVNTVGVS